MPRRFLTILAIAVAGRLALVAQVPAYDLVLRNARIVDGTGSPWYRGDVALRGETIARIAPAITEPATRVIDVAGQVVAPGFIDIHSHARRGIFMVPTAENYVRQGVTTLIEGPDGSSPIPLAPFLDLSLTYNRGISYGLWQQDSELGRNLLIAISLAAAGLFAFWLRRTGSRLVALALGFLIGGAVGNAIDRTIHGAVVDFVSLHALGWRWYVFNVADSAIVAGVVGLLYDAAFGGATKRPPSKGT